MEKSSSGAWAEILKYPATVFSIVAALIIAKQFGINITEIGKDGVKLSQEQRGEIAQTAATAHAAFTAVQALQKDTKAATPAHTAEVFEASQTVPDQTAKLAEFAPSGEAGGRRGYIWIGDYQPNQGWSRAKLAPLNSDTGITQAPQGLVRGSDYKVLGNMVVRDGLPSNDDEYFRSRKSLGVIPRGTKVTLTAMPTEIKRPFASQWWAEVQIP